MNEPQINELEQLLAWTNLPVPDVLQQLPSHQQQQVVSWANTLVNHKTEGFEDLYSAISMIVKYIPHFMVIPLMVEYIRPQIAAGVCRKMGVDQATGYANDLPLKYFSEVSKHIDADVMAQILEKMKKGNVEKFIHYELEHHQSRMLEIAQHLNRHILEVVAKHVTLPDYGTDLAINPYKEVIDKIRTLQ
ncbi:MAG: hypothetical protein NT163_10920 [Chlorobiales bacterium]|nr:hypothetical protein [Chlorobiales bacterium]